MTVSISPTPRKQYVDANGNPLVGGKVFFYAAGSTTKQNTYTDSTGATPNSNPIVLDSQGRTPLPVWFTDGLSYKEVLAPSTDTDPPSSGVTMGDNLLGSGASIVTQSQWILQAVTPTYISASSFTVPGDQTAEFHVGRRYKAIVSGGVSYGFITSSVYTSLTTVTVQVDSTAIDSGVSSISLGILTVTDPAIPNVPRVLNASNRIMNSRFLVWQAGPSFPAAAVGYDADGWQHSKITTAVLTIARDASGPVVGVYNRKITFTTADASIASTDYIQQVHRIEGYSCTDLIGITFTIGFWVKATLTGIHCLALYTGTNSRVYEYTINTTNTWEYKTITVINGVPEIASYTTGYGLQVVFTNMCGSNYHAAVGSWNAGVFLGTSNQVNDAGTINNTFSLGIVTLNIGTTVTNDEYDYQKDLMLCMRYYQQLIYQNNQYGTAGMSPSFTVPFYSSMQIVPTVGNISGPTYSNSSALTLLNITESKFLMQYTITATGGALAYGELSLSARL